MDFLFVNFHKSAVILLGPVAILMSLRTALLATSRDVDINEYCKRSQSFDMKGLFKILSILLSNTSAKDLTAIDDPFTGSGPLDSNQQARASIAASAGSPILSLLKGRYPAYDGYPVFIVDWQIEQREKAIALTVEGERRQDVLRQLEMKVVQVEAEHDRWVRRHEAAADANQRHKQSIMVKEKEDLERARRDQEDLTAQRLVNLTTVDDVAEKQVEMIERANQDQAVILQRAELEMNERMESLLLLQRHRDIADKAHKTESDKLTRMHIDASKEARNKSLSDAISQKEQKIMQENAAQIKRWELEDETRRKDRELRTVETEKEMKSFSTSQQDSIKIVLDKMQSDRDFQISEIVKERKMRGDSERIQMDLEDSERTHLRAEQDVLLAERCQMDDDERRMCDESKRGSNEREIRGDGGRERSSDGFREGEEGRERYREVDGREGEAGERGVERGREGMERGGGREVMKETDNRNVTINQNSIQSVREQQEQRQQLVQQQYYDRQQKQEAQTQQQQQKQQSQQEQQQPLPPPRQQQQQQPQLEQQQYYQPPQRKSQQPRHQRQQQQPPPLPPSRRQEQQQQYDFLQRYDNEQNLQTESNEDVRRNPKDLEKSKLKGQHDMGKIEYDQELQRRQQQQQQYDFLERYDDQDYDQNDGQKSPNVPARGSSTINDEKINFRGKYNDTV